MIEIIMKGFANEGTSTQPHKAKAAYLRQRGDTSKLLVKRTLRRYLNSIRTAPNVIEKYVCLALIVNLPGTFGQSSLKASLQKAINTHSLELLTGIIKQLPSDNNNSKKIQKLLLAGDGLKPDLIKYYNEFHYANDINFK